MIILSAGSLNLREEFAFSSLPHPLRRKAGHRGGRLADFQVPHALFAGVASYALTGSVPRALVPRAFVPRTFVSLAHLLIANHSMESYDLHDVD